MMILFMGCCTLVVGIVAKNLEVCAASKISAMRHTTRWIRNRETENEYLNPCLVHPVALAINKKNEPPLFATVFVVYSHCYMFFLENE
jgi:hypothetical protein